MPYNAIDLFSGCGGMTEGLIDAGFHVVAAVEIDSYAAETYRANHTQHGVILFEIDIRQLQSNRILCSGKYFTNPMTHLRTDWRFWDYTYHNV